MGQLFKVIVHVGTVQNFEIGIFVENKDTLIELIVGKKCFSIRLVVCEIRRTRVFTRSKIVRRAAYFRSELLETCFG